jgi:hypothetical protein
MIDVPVAAPSNRLTEYTVDITCSSNLGQINYRILITRFTPNQPPFPFEMLLTAEQFAILTQMFCP